jgi:3D (Asp-Asp-Asp) domain-containing protein
MSRPGKALVYMFPLLVGSTILLLGHTALTQQTRPAERASSESAARAQRAPVVDGSVSEFSPADGDEGRIEESHAPAPRPSRPARRVERPAAAEKPRKAARKDTPRTVTVRMLVTGYCPCRKCCGKFADGKTASGRRITYNRGRFVAADTSLLPFGTKVSIPGYHGGRPVPVEDRGGRIKGRRLDLFFFSHHQAREWGSQWVDVTVYLEDDE